MSNNGFYSDVSQAASFKTPCLRPINGAPAVEKLEHVSFVRLIPRNFHGGDRPEVQPLDERRIHQLINKDLVFCNRGHYQRWPNLFQHFRLRNFNHTRIRTEELPIRQRMRERVTEHDRWAQIDSAFELRFP